MEKAPGRQDTELKAASACLPDECISMSLIVLTRRWRMKWLTDDLVEMILIILKSDNEEGWKKVERVVKLLIENSKIREGEFSTNSSHFSIGIRLQIFHHISDRIGFKSSIRINKLEQCKYSHRWMLVEDWMNDIRRHIQGNIRGSYYEEVPRTAIDYHAFHDSLPSETHCMGFLDRLRASRFAFHWERDLHRISEICHDSKAYGEWMWTYHCKEHRVEVP